MASAGIARFYIRKPGRTGHAGDDLGRASRHYIGEDFRRKRKEDPLHGVPSDNATGIVPIKSPSKDGD